jgi:hypothetical protein
MSRGGQTPHCHFEGNLHEKHDVDCSLDVLFIVAVGNVFSTDRSEELSVDDSKTEGNRKLHGLWTVDSITGPSQEARFFAGINLTYFIVHYKYNYDWAKNLKAYQELSPRVQFTQAGAEVQGAVLISSITK